MKRGAKCWHLIYHRYSWHHLYAVIEINPELYTVEDKVEFGDEERVLVANNDWLWRVIF